MQTALDALVALAQRYAFAEVAALAAAGAGSESLSAARVAELDQLCSFGQRLIDLDAEDFGVVDSRKANAIPADLIARALQCRMPQSSKETHRGALGSLRPAYQLLLEVIDARFRRGETTAVVAAVHIASEYAPLLVWERVLGHSGDPARIGTAVSGEGSIWGDFEDRDCPHTRTEKSAAKRILTVSQENDAGWRAYFDRQHSNASHALAVCAAECKRPCSVYTRLSTADAEVVTHGCRLAISLNESAIVRLRHSAPVGHGFGVPSSAELAEAWGRTRDSLARIDATVAEADDFALPGFKALVEAMAGQALEPGRMLLDTAQQITTLLRAGAKAQA